MEEPIDVSMLETAPMDGNCLEMGNLGAVMAAAEDESADVEVLNHSVDEIITKVDKIEKRVNEVSQFYSSLSKKQANGTKGSSVTKDKEKDKQSVSIKKLQQDDAKRKAASAKRMQELMRQFATILRQITQHRWAFPFMQPVDVEGLGLDDYHQVIEKPMDFSTIKNQMEAKDGSGYKNVREICADVRLVFKNAMTYNDDRNDVHVMAKTLLEKFEEKWLQLLPKVVEEEKKRKEEDAKARLDMQLLQEAANTKLARDIRNELYDVDTHLEELREMVVRRCRKMSAEERIKLGISVSQLSTEDLQKVVEIIAQNDPNIQATANTDVDIDIDAQSESTLWRLKAFVKGTLENKCRDSQEVKAKSSPEVKGKSSPEIKGKSSATKSGNDKRKREICEALAKTAKKRKKLSS